MKSRSTESLAELANGRMVQILEDDNAKPELHIRAAAVVLRHVAVERNRDLARERLEVTKQRMQNRSASRNYQSGADSSEQSMEKFMDVLEAASGYAQWMQNHPENCACPQCQSINGRYAPAPAPPPPNTG